MGGVRMCKAMHEEWSAEFSRGCRHLMSSQRGITHFELLEYLLLIIMVLGIVLVLGTSFSEVQAKIWAKVQNELLSLN
jgi:uncharacterized protein involved in cysteine biosynthesis